MSPTHQHLNSSTLKSALAMSPMSMKHIVHCTLYPHQHAPSAYPAHALLLSSDICYKYSVDSVRALSKLFSQCQLTAVDVFFRATGSFNFRAYKDPHVFSTSESATTGQDLALAKVFFFFGHANSSINKYIVERFLNKQKQVKNDNKTHKLNESNNKKKGHKVAEVQSSSMVPCRNKLTALWRNIQVA